jgi:hypothetical protein
MVAKKKVAKKGRTTKNTKPVVQVKDFWYDSDCRTNARTEIAEGSVASEEFSKVLFEIMLAKRDARRMSDSEGGAKPGKVYGSLLEAQNALAEKLSEAGLKLSCKSDNKPPGAKEYARALCSYFSPSQRIFDVRHPEELKR